MKFRKQALAVAAGALALLVAGCSASDSSTSTTTSAPAADVVKIGLITKFPVDFYDIMVDAAKEWDANEPGAEVIYAQGKSGTDDEGEIAAIQSMVSQGVDAIAITPTSPNVATELQKAVDAGIKVILIDNDIPDWDGKTAVVATDNYAGGVLAGQWLADNLPDGAKLAVLQGVLGNPSLQARVDGMLSALGDKATVVATTPTDCDQTKGLNAGQDILTANPDLTAIYAACGPPLIGALEAIKSADSRASSSRWASTPRPTRLRRSSRARRPARSPSSRRRWAASAFRPRSMRRWVRPSTRTLTLEPRW